MVAHSITQRPDALSASDSGGGGRWETGGPSVGIGVWRRTRTRRRVAIHSLSQREHCVYISIIWFSDDVHDMARESKRGVRAAHVLDGDMLECGCRYLHRFY